MKQENSEKMRFHCGRRKGFEGALLKITCVVGGGSSEPLCYVSPLNVPGRMDQ